VFAPCSNLSINFTFFLNSEYSGLVLISASAELIVSLFVPLGNFASISFTFNGTSDSLKIFLILPAIVSLPA
jgi:hypothetical protein